MTKLRDVSVWIVAAAAGVAWACAGAGPAAPTAEEARKFIDDANETMLRVSVAEGQTGWVAETYITEDTEAISARANQAFSDQIAKLATLRDLGAITTEEYEAKKAELLDRM